MTFDRLERRVDGLRTRIDAGEAVGRNDFSGLFDLLKRIFGGDEIAKQIKKYLGPDLSKKRQPKKGPDKVSGDDSPISMAVAYLASAAGDERLPQIVRGVLVASLQRDHTAQIDVLDGVDAMIDQASSRVDAAGESKRGQSNARVKAKAAYQYAIERIPGAADMTVKELHAAISAHDEINHLIPAKPDTFRKYLNQGDIAIKKSMVAKEPGRSIVREHEI